MTQKIRELNGRFEACNLFVRREAFLAVGGFDPDAWGWEDTIGGWALLLAGWEPDFAPGAVVHHEVTQPPFGWWLRRGRIDGNAALAVKRDPELRERLLFGHAEGLVEARPARALKELRVGGRITAS